MSTVRRGAGWAALAASGLLLASCGMVSALGDEDAGEQTATVAVLVPSSGWQQADGAGVLAAVEAAIAETTDDIGGWTVDVVAIDDGESGPEAAEPVSELVDGDAVAVIGGLSTRTVRAVQPVLDDESVLFVSPADVDPVHTRGADPGDPLRPYRSYFRTSVGAETPAAALGRYAVSSAGADAVAVVDGGDPAEARAFSEAVEDAGGGVVASGTDQNVAAVVAKAKDEGAEAVFVAGSPDAATAVSAQVRRAGLDAVLLGASAFGGSFADDGRDGAVTAARAELDATADARPDGLSGRLDADLGAYGAAAYDAGTVVGTVLDRCLPPASSASAARRGCIGEMAELDFAGVTGDVSFDDFGDRIGGTVQFSVLRDDRWQAVEADE